MDSQIVNNETINQSLKEHQIAATDWEMQGAIKTLHDWSGIFVFEFKLQTDIPAIMIDNLGRSRYGHFRIGRNGFGLRNEIGINNRYFQNREFWQVLGTLLHELLHAEQEQTGKPGKNNYHNKQFRDRADSLGLIIDGWGHTIYKPAPSPFFDILEKYGVSIPNLPKPVAQTKEKGNSKLKAWICDCSPPVHVRVAISDFQAKCLKCGSKFRMK